MEHLFTVPSVYQTATSYELFGIYPDASVDALWNPACVKELKKYWLDFLRLRYEYDDFIAYRTLFPIHKGKISMGGMIFLAEEHLYSDWELHEHNRGELFLNYDGRVKYGISLFVDRKDWWYKYSEKVTKEGWNTVLGAKLGFYLDEKTQASVVTSKEDTALNRECFVCFTHRTDAYGWTLLYNMLPYEKFNFIGAYHVNKIESSKLIKAVKIIWEEEKMKYCFPLVVNIDILKQLTMLAGYTLRIEYFEKQIYANKDFSLGCIYNHFPLTVTINMGEEPFKTNYWEVGLSLTFPYRE